jgi:hypothetical protein
LEKYNTRTAPIHGASRTLEVRFLDGYSYVVQSQSHDEIVSRGFGAAEYQKSYRNLHVTRQIILRLLWL